jgi:POT family proton-dependent oligopeptide transporter
MNLGIVAGELLSPFIREFWASNIEGLDIKTVPAAGISGAFWFFTLVTIVLLVLHLTLFTRKVEERDLMITNEEEAEEPQRTFMEKLKGLPIMDVRFLFFIFILLPVRTLFAHQFLTMPLFVARAYPAAVAAKWEWIYVINPVIIVIFVPLIAAMTLRRRVLDLMIVGTAVSAVCSFILCTEPNLTLLITYMVAFSFGEAIWSSRFLEYIADLAPARRVGIYMGIATIPWFLAKMTTGLYAGAMLDRFVPASGPQSPQTLWFIYGLIAITSPIGLLLARRWLLRSVRNEGVGSKA